MTILPGLEKMASGAVKTPGNQFYNSPGGLLDDLE